MIINTMRDRRIIIITWVSCSWKTTLQNELLSRWWERPFNYTTRKPRDGEAFLNTDEEGDFTSNELDEYIFLKEELFYKKLRNGDFLESTNYLWNHYWVSSSLPKWNVCIVLDPVGRSQVLEHFVRRWIEVETYYVEINKDLQKERLVNRWDDEKQIISRKRDFKWFSPTNKCIRLNGAKDADLLADLIENNNDI